MSSHPHSTVVLNQVAFSWPDGTAVLDQVSAGFGAARTGLIGANGAGKTTLLRLIAGSLRPTSGVITAPAAVGRLDQDFTLGPGSTVVDLLGIRARVDALSAIEAGQVEQDHFDRLADDWGVRERADGVLGRFGLGTIELDRTVSTLSGGEAMAIALAGLWVNRTPLVLLDEPTNNLDRRSRQRLYAMINEWPGCLVIVSHDTALLELTDETAELRDGQLTIFGGPYSAYRGYLEQEQQAAEQAVRTAEQDLRRQRRQRFEAETKLARRQRYAKTDFENKRRPKAIMKQRETEAQVSAGKLRRDLDNDVTAAREELAEREARVRDDQRIRIALPDPQLPATKRLAELYDRQRCHVIAGPERVALTGPNGIGKTRLLETMVHAAAPSPAGVGAVALTDRVGYLPQRLDQLADRTDVLTAVRAATGDRSPDAVRAQLARFLFRGDAVYRAVGSLSGGERFRVALARLLLAEPAHQLLVMDEPTNNLDLHSIEELVGALTGYRGALLVVSHDDAFLDRLGIARWIEHGGDRLIKH